MLNNTAIRVKEKNGRRRFIGKANGDTFTAFRRDEDKHLFRGGLDSVREAKEQGRAAWGLDLTAMVQLHDEHDVKYVEIPTMDVRYRTTMEVLLGPKGFISEYGGHRPQVMLPLQYWTKIGTE